MLIRILLLILLLILILIPILIPILILILLPPFTPPAQLVRFVHSSCVLTPQGLRERTRSVSHGEPWAEFEAETSPESTWLWSRIATARPATWPTPQLRTGRSPQVHM